VGRRYFFGLLGSAAAAVGLAPVGRIGVEIVPPFEYFPAFGELELLQERRNVLERQLFNQLLRDSYAKTIIAELNAAPGSYSALVRDLFEQ
jgi:hypothetical protein